MDDVTYEPLCKDDAAEETPVVIAAVPTPEGHREHRINLAIAAILICLSAVFCAGTVLWLFITGVQTVEDKNERNHTTVSMVMFDLWRFR